MASTGMRNVSNPLLFESAWEVANKVGGIYTVIKTKVSRARSSPGTRVFARDAALDASVAM